MSMHRTTLMLDEPARKASRRLAQKLGVSPSEVMRRALALMQAEVVGVSDEDRKKRVAAFERLVDLSAKVDTKTELARLKRERRQW